MKKLIKITGALLIVMTYSFSSKAQTSHVGGGITFLKPSGGSEIGINAKGAFGLNENMEISPSANYYFTDGYTLIDLNGDFHYLLGDEGSFRFYPLAGLNFLMARQEAFQQNELQFNIGGGARYPLNESISIYAEGKYMIGDADALVFSAGIMFKIGG